MICKALAGNFLAGVLYVSTKSSKIITKKLQKSYCKLVSKELQYGYSKGTSPAECEIFFFLFLGYRAQVLLLRLFSFTVVIHVPHRRYPASCAKKLVRSGRAFLHPQITQKPASHAGKYDLTPFWWAICLFFCKGHLQSLARRGFVFRLALWYSIYNQFIGCKHESD